MDDCPAQLHGSHVHWPPGYDDADQEGTDFGAAVHRMKGCRRGASSSWTPRFPNDRFVQEFGVTLEEMQRAEQG